MKIAQNLDISEFLDSEEKISAYLTAIMEDNDLPLLLQAIGHIAKARGMATIAKDSGLGRESLYKAFNENSQPKFDTVKRVLNAMNISINFTPTTDPKSGANSPIRSSTRSSIRSRKQKEAA
jgi:probable addiction module antidote protein